MTMQPELKHALDTGVSIPEVIEIFAKHHGGPKEKKVLWEDDRPRFRSIMDVRSVPRGHKNSEFWDTWNPLFWRLPSVQGARDPPLGDDVCLNIHEALTRDIISWLCDSKRKSNVCIIAEPLTSDYSLRNYSRASAISMIYWNARPFGQLLQTTHYEIIFQLSAGATYPQYRRILTQIMIDNPGIRELLLRTLFKKLIYEPWKTLQQWNFGYDATPPFKLPIQGLVDPLVPFRHIRLPTCYNEVLADAALLLNNAFRILRRKYGETFDDDGVCPSKEQMSQLARIVSGVFGFVDVIIRFVDWKDNGGPRVHLETFLEYMVDSPAPSEEHRYSALDHFYTRALSSIAPDLFFGMKKALSIIKYTSRDYLFRPIQLLSLLLLGNDTFLPYFDRLAMVGNGFSGGYRKPRCPHFSYFLEDPNRSGQFYTPESESRLDALQAWLDFLGHSSDPSVILREPPVAQRIRYNKGNVRGLQLGDLRFRACLELCESVNKGLEAQILSLLRRFDFRCLAHTCDHIKVTEFTLFIKCLYKWDKGNSPSIVRVEPSSMRDLDRQFIDKCEGIAEPLDLDDKFDFYPSTCPKYVLLGYGVKTVLAVMDSGVGRGSETLDEFKSEEDRGVNIYTSAVLDYI